MKPLCSLVSWFGVDDHVESDITGFALFLKCGELSGIVYGCIFVSCALCPVVVLRTIDFYEIHLLPRFR